MTTEYIISNANCATAAIGKFQNIVPIKGSVYGANGQVYTKLPLGNNGDSLTADSTASQGLSWKPYFNPINPSITFNLFGCFGWNQNNTYFNTFGTNPPAGTHSTPHLISFNFDTYVIALGFKPRASTNSGSWASSMLGLWNGTLYFDIVGCADSADPSLGLTAMTTPPAPHFTITNAQISTIYMTKHWVAVTPVYIPARTKFSVRTTWAPGTIFHDPNNDCYGTGNLILTGIPN